MTRQPDPQALSQAAFLLRLSARPVILAGGGAIGADEELARIAETLDAPVITTWRGKGALPDRNLFSAGALFGRAEATAALEGADTVFAVGTSFQAGPGAPEPDLPAQMIQIDADPAQLGRRHPLRLGITGDARLALAGILTELASPNPLKGVADRTSVAEGDRTGPGRARQLREAARARAGASGAGRLEALAAIRSALPEDTTILHRDAASAPWFHPFFEVAVAGTWLLGAEGSPYPVAEAAAAAGAAGGALVTICDERELIPHLPELEGLEEPGNLVFLVFTDRGDPEVESALQRAAGEAGLSVKIASGPQELAAALARAVSGSTHSIIESDLTWDAPPA